METARRLPIELVTKRLQDLKGITEIKDIAWLREEELAHMICDGFQQLVDEYNNLEADDFVLDECAMTNTLWLKRTGNVEQLPAVAEVYSKYLRFAIREAVPLMLRAQQIQTDPTPFSQDEIDQAIKTPTLPTTPFAKSLGIAGHIIERMYFAYFRDNNIFPEDSSHFDEPWEKDAVLLPLEEVMLLLHAEATVVGGEEPILYQILTSPNSLDETGGLGWRTPEQVKAVEVFYRELIDKIDQYELPN